MKITGQTPLNAQALPSDEMSLLKSLWIETAEEAIAFEAALPKSEALASRFASLRSALESRTLSVAPITPERLKTLGTPRKGGGLGCLVDPRMIEAFRRDGRIHAARPLPLGAFEAGIPRAVRLLNRMPPVRNQGGRGTCVAFAGVALREYLLADRVALSEQFLYWACKELDGDPAPGTYIHTAMTAFAEYGVCPAPVWPYNSHPSDVEGQGPPPQGAREAASSYRLPSARTVESGLVLHYKHVLAGKDGKGGMPIVIGTLVFDSWYQSAETNRTGKITLPFPGEEPVGGHAWCVVGYVDDEAVPGGGYFVVRNSWGAEWGSDSPEAPGHALMPYAYVERCADEAYTGPESMRQSEASDGAEEWGAYVRKLECDTRDTDGRLLKKGTPVLFDPGSPGVLREDTPSNRHAFLLQDRTWVSETRMRRWFPAKADWAEDFALERERAQAACASFLAAIEENLKTALQSAFPDVNLPSLAALMPFQPRIRRLAQETDLSTDLAATILRSAGAPAELEPPREWAEAVAAVNAIRVYKLRSLPADARVVAVFVTPLRLRRDRQPVFAPPAAETIEAVRALVARRLAAMTGRKPVYTFFTLAAAQPWPEGQKGLAVGDACILLSHRTESGGWHTAVPPFFATRTTFRNFLERVCPVTRQERVSKIKAAVDGLLAEGYRANITVAKIASRTAFRQTTVRDAFLAMQEVSPDKYRVERVDRHQIAIRRCRPGEPLSLTSRSFRKGFLRRHILLFVSAGVGVSGWVLRSRVRLDGTLGFLLLVFLVYVTGIIQTKINRRATEEKES